MSIDLDWNKLDSSLASSLIVILNRQLQSATRPSFIGPVEVTSFDFGSQPPEIELVDLRDIYRDFLEDDDDNDGDAEGNIDAERDPARSAGRAHDEDDEFEWVSRRSAGRGMAEEAPMYHHLPPHVRYGRGPASEMFTSPYMHLLVSWHSDLRLTLTTSLRINYPSPALAVAYEGGRRIHLCVLDDLDPYGPSARRGSGSQGSTPSDLDADDADGTKPLPVGQRLLPDIFIESELGQADKHVLKNVTRVEKFIQDVIRKTIEEELVFPNYHTLVIQ
ncbi:hypothetical protein EDB89DRAFT_2110560 [Lactarius sanguifluus]|nr:hypothetical protein EDB89DRAFT_2110560 [Lactarius sanguifluus]